MVLLLEYHPKTEEETPSEDFSDNLIQRTCVQCHFNFLQNKDEVLKCLCWFCRRPKDEEPKDENLPTIIIPSFTSRLKEFDELTA